MSFKDSAKAQFAGYLAREMLSVKVDGIDEPVYYRPVDAMNPIQADKLFEYRKRGTVEALIDIIILRARDEDGTKMFTAADRTEMLNMYGATLLADIVTEMNKEVSPDPK